MVGNIFKLDNFWIIIWIIIDIDTYRRYFMDNLDNPYVAKKHQLQDVFEARRTDTEKTGQSDTTHTTGETK